MRHFDNVASHNRVRFSVGLRVTLQQRWQRFGKEGAGTLARRQRRPSTVWPRLKIKTPRTQPSHTDLLKTKKPSTLCQQGRLGKRVHLRLLLLRLPHSAAAKATVLWAGTGYTEKEVALQQPSGQFSVLKRSLALVSFGLSLIHISEPTRPY